MLLAVSGLGLSTRCNHLACCVLHSFVSMSRLTRLRLGWTQCITEALANLVSHSLFVLLVNLGSLFH
jgi:hypothetical protein